MKKYLFLFLATTFLSIVPIVTRAQTYIPSNRIPIADNTLGTQVTGNNGTNFTITGGLNRGQTLFHSFNDFSVPTNGQANFNNPIGNRDIITRVTGNLFSDINGLLNTNGANFLLINPNGVVFGPGAQLNVGKAFVTSTASGIDFVDAQGQNYNFGVNRQGDPLLSIAPDVVFNPARLTMNASIPGSKGIENYGTLQTNNSGQYIGLIGGNVNFYGGRIIAPGGKVELGGLVQSGTVGFSLDNGVLFPANVERGNVSLVTIFTSPSLIDVKSGGGGSIEIVAKDITLRGSSARIRAGIAAGLGSPTARSGDIKLDATDNIGLFDNAFIDNSVSVNAEGKVGGIEIVTGDFFMINGSALSTGTLGKGDAGNIKITAAKNVSFDNLGVKDNEFTATYLDAGVYSGAEGKAGRIDIVTRNLSFIDGAGLFVASRKQEIKEIIKDGKPAEENINILNANRGGDIFLTTNTITLNRGFISSGSASFNGGNINLVTTDFLLLRNDSLIATNSNSTGENGNGGNITISSPLIIALPGNNDITANANQGNGGRINITSQGLFGIQYRPTASRFTNDITVSSISGQSGSVQINTPGIDPGKDTGELPAAPNDASNQISQACSASQRENKFYITGRGGLPPNASDPQESEALWQDAREVKTKPATTASQPPKFAPPAIGWVFQPDGRVRLIAAQSVGGATGAKAVCPILNNW
jgi:filamentous hemagglutinin family protein